MITLYGVPVSAFVAKVRIVLDAKDLAYEELLPPGGYGSDDYRAIVPSGSVPGIVVENNALHDSNAIVEYLEERWPEPRLLPEDPMERARARALLGFHDTRLEAAARSLFPLVKDDWRATPDRVETGAAAIEGALDRLGDLIAPRPFIFGDDPTLADLAFPVTIQMAEMLTAEMGRPLTVPPDIDAWRRRLADHPAVARSLKIAGAAMEDWLAGFR